MYIITISNISPQTTSVSRSEWGANQRLMVLVATEIRPRP